MQCVFLPLFRRDSRGRVGRGAARKSVGKARDAPSRVGGKLKEGYEKTGSEKTLYAMELARKRGESSGKLGVFVC